MASYPIWKDVTHAVTVAGEYYDYEVHCGDEVIHRGRVYVMPGETSAVIPIANIVRSFLSGAITLRNATLPSSFPVTEWSKSVRIYDVVSEEYIGDYTFYADWSYVEWGITESQPILASSRMQNVLDRRQLMMYSIAYMGGIGEEYAIIKNAAVVHRGRIRTDMTTDAIPMSTFGAGLGNVVITVGEAVLAEYDIADTCASHALYYMNAYGGWDYLLVAGNVLREDIFERVMMTRKVDNRRPEHGDVVVSETVGVTWKLYTDYLSDEQWKLMSHLIGSPKVYLHDLNSEAITPVAVTDTNVVYKTFSNQGRKKSYAEINVQLAQPRYRR